MNKKLIALAVSGAALSTGASAVELYNNDGTTFAVGGHVSASVGGSDLADTAIKTNSPRINFNATQEVGNGFTVDAKGEWALNFLEGGENSFTTRLGYIGISHDDFGRAVAGTQWAPYYDVAGVADMPIAFANDFIYENHGNLGTGRAEKMASYRIGFDLADAGNIALGAGIQGRNDATSTGGEFDDNGDYVETESGAHYGNRVQVTLAYNIADFGIGYAFNTGDFTPVGEAAKKAESHVISANYGSYGKGLYVAGVYGMNENMQEYTNYSIGGLSKMASGTIENSNAYEFLVAYALSNGINLSVNYEAVEDTDASKTVYSQSALQAEYNFTPKFVGFAGYQFDLGSDYTNVENNTWNMGVRYYL